MSEEAVRAVAGDSIGDSGSTSRRRFLVGSSVGAGTIWAAPVVLGASARAAAASGAVVLFENFAGIPTNTTANSAGAAIGSNFTLTSGNVDFRSSSQIPAGSKNGLAIEAGQDTAVITSNVAIPAGTYTVRLRVAGNFDGLTGDDYILVTLGSLVNEPIIRDKDDPFSDAIFTGVTVAAPQQMVITIVLRPPPPLTTENLESAHLDEVEVSS